MDVRLTMDLSVSDRHMLERHLRQLYEDEMSEPVEIPEGMDSLLYLLGWVSLDLGEMVELCAVGLEVVGSQAREV